MDFMLKSYTIRMKEHLCDTNGIQCDVRNIAFDQFHRMHRLSSRDAWPLQPNTVAVSMVMTAVCHLDSMLSWPLSRWQCIDSVMNRTNRMWNLRKDADWLEFYCFGPLNQPMNHVAIHCLAASLHCDNPSLWDSHHTVKLDLCMDLAFDGRATRIDCQTMIHCLAVLAMVPKTIRLIGKKNNYYFFFIFLGRNENVKFVSF